jgi:hypothetical protein
MALILPLLSSLFSMSTLSTLLPPCIQWYDSAVSLIPKTAIFLGPPLHIALMQHLFLSRRYLVLLPLQRLSKAVLVLLKAAALV